jgi:hypothetical protein
VAKRRRLAPLATPGQSANALLQADARMRASSKIFSQLAALGFSGVHLHRLLAKPKGLEALHALCALTPELLAFGLGQAELGDIAGYYGAAQTLATLALDGGKLLDLGFTPQQQGRMAKADSAGTALIAAQRHTGDLLQAGFDSEDIVKIAGNIGGAQALQFVSDHLDALKAKFDVQDIVKMAGNGGGAQALGAVLDHFDALTKAKFEAKVIVKIAGNIGGAQAVKGALAARSAYAEAFLPNETIIAIAMVAGSGQILFLMAEQAEPIQRHVQAASLLEWATKRRRNFQSFKQQLEAALRVHA